MKERQLREESAPPFKSQPDFREVYAELSRDFRKKLRYNPGFPTSATYDESHSLRSWVTLNFREKKNPSAAPSRNFREALSIHDGGPFI